MALNTSKCNAMMTPGFKRLIRCNASTRCDSSQKNPPQTFLGLPETLLLAADAVVVESTAAEPASASADARKPPSQPPPPGGATYPDGSTSNELGRTEQVVSSASESSVTSSPVTASRPFFNLLTPHRTAHL